jgi:hypothetical protein
MTEYQEQLVHGPNGTAITRREFLKLPMDVRRKCLDEQVRKMWEGMTDEQKLKEMHDMMD